MAIHRFEKKTATGMFLFAILYICKNVKVCVELKDVYNKYKIGSL